MHAPPPGALFGSGPAGFAPAQHFADGNMDDSTIVAGDFDGDGRLDVVVGGFKIVAQLNRLPELRSLLADPDQPGHSPAVPKVARPAGR